MSSDVEKGQILALREEGYTYRSIANRIHRSKTLVGKFLMNPDGYGTAKRSGRPSKFSGADRRRIQRNFSNASTTIRSFVDNSGLEVSRETVRRVINESEHIVRQRMAPAPSMKPVHIERRLVFARENMGTNWATVGNVYLRLILRFFYF